MSKKKSNQLHVRKWKCFYWTNLRTTTGKAWIGRHDVWIRQIYGNLWVVQKQSKLLQKLKGLYEQRKRFFS